MKLQNFKRITSDDFEQDYKDLVDKLGFLLNLQIEQITQGFSKNIDFNNLRQEIKYITVTVDSDGIPSIPTNFKNNLTSNVIGLQVIKVQCLSNNALFPINCPFITFAENGRIVNISNISGLVADESFKLTVITYV